MGYRNCNIFHQLCSKYMFLMVIFIYSLRYCFKSHSFVLCYHQRQRWNISLWWVKGKCRNNTASLHAHCTILWNPIRVLVGYAVCRCVVEYLTKLFEMLVSVLPTTFCEKLVVKKRVGTVQWGSRVCSKCSLSLYSSRYFEASSNFKGQTVVEIVSCSRLVSTDLQLHHLDRYN